MNTQTITNQQTAIDLMRNGNILTFHDLSRGASWSITSTTNTHDIHYCIYRVSTSICRRLLDSGIIRQNNIGMLHRNYVLV